MSTSDESTPALIKAHCGEHRQGVGRRLFLPRLASSGAYHTMDWVLPVFLLGRLLQRCLERREAPAGAGIPHGHIACNITGYDLHPQEPATAQPRRKRETPITDCDPICLHCSAPRPSLRVRVCVCARPCASLLAPADLAGAERGAPSLTHQALKQLAGARAKRRTSTFHEREPT